MKAFSQKLPNSALTEQQIESSDQKYFLSTNEEKISNVSIAFPKYSTAQTCNKKKKKT